MLLYLTDLLLHIGYSGLQMIFDGMIQVEIDGRKIMVKYGGKFDDIGGLGDFGNDGGNQLLQFLS